MRLLKDNNYTKTTQELVLLFLTLSILYIPIFRELINAWNVKPEASHGYFILPISLYLAWRNREELSRYQPRGEVYGLGFIFLGLSLYLIGGITKSWTLSNISLMFNILGILLSILGRKITHILIFPIFFLFFMIPIPDAIYVFMTGPLKLLVSYLSANILQGLGIALIREGNIFHFAHIDLEVVEACSGLRSLISYVVFGTLLTYFLPKNTPLKKVILIAFTLPIALLINITRIVITGLLSNFLGSSMAEGFFHIASGTVLFFVGACILIGIFYLLNEWNTEDKGST